MTPANAVSTALTPRRAVDDIVLFSIKVSDYEMEQTSWRVRFEPRLKPYPRPSANLAPPEDFKRYWQHPIA